MGGLLAGARIVGRLFLCGFAALVLVGGSASAHDTAAAPTPPHNPAYSDLRAASSGPCQGGFVVEDTLPGVGCTHGPDRKSSDAGLSRAAGLGAPRLGAPGTVPCIGDGSSGARVEAVYVHASDKPDRFALAAPIIAASLTEMAESVQQSAEETGGFRTIRFATSSCEPVIHNVALSPSGDDSIGQTASELYALGFNSAERDYVVFVDASVYCGIGYVNLNFARVDTGCWSGHTALHELTHNFGAVQLSAPNSSGGFHCTDESDTMCYSDEPYYPPMRQICPLAHELLLDCNHDDYFSTAPPVGSFLSVNPDLNTADSPFLADVDGESPVFLPEVPTTYTGARYTVHAYNADDDECVYGEGPGAPRRVRFFCIGNNGDRTADVTGALLSVAGGNPSATVRLVATDRGGANAFGFSVLKDGVPVTDHQAGQVGVRSAELSPGAPDPITGWPVIYEETLTADLSPTVLPEKTRGSSASCRRSARKLRHVRRSAKRTHRRLWRMYRSLKRRRARLLRSGSRKSSRRYTRQLQRYRRQLAHSRVLKRKQRRLQRSVRRRCRR